MFKADGSYIRPAEDLVTIWAIALIHKQYGISLDALELELSTDFSEGTYQGGRRYQLGPNTPFEWIDHHHLSAAAPQVPCLPLSCSDRE